MLAPLPSEGGGTAVFVDSEIRDQIEFKHFDSVVFSINL
jgi:hypothetical protein